MKPTSFFDDDDIESLEQPQKKKIWSNIEHKQMLLQNIQHIQLFHQFHKRSKKQGRSKQIIFILNHEGLYQIKTKHEYLTNFLDLTCVKIEFLQNIPQQEAILIDKEFFQNQNPLCGFRLYKNNKYLDIFTHSQEQWDQWKQALTYRCVQSNFHEEFQVQKMIGKGSFAKVFQAVKKSSQGSLFAIKAFNKDFISNQPKGKEQLKGEIHIMRQLNSEYLIRLYEIYETSNSIYLVLDLINGGELIQRIRQQGQMSQFQLIMIMRNLMKAIQYMHSQNIMHRDIKPENLLLKQKDSEGYDVVLADFGLATAVGNNNALFKRCGTPGFVAPEVIQYEDQNPLYGPQCDIFSAGIIFYLLLTGIQPFKGKDYQGVINSNKVCHIDFDIPELKMINNEAFDLLKKMLQLDPSQRPTATEVLNHPFLYNENELNDQKVQLSCVRNLENYKQEPQDNIGNNQIDKNQDLLHPLNLQIIQESINLESQGTLSSIQSLNSPQVIEKKPEKSKFCEKFRIQSIDMVNEINNLTSSKVQTQYDETPQKKSDQEKKRNSLFQQALSKNFINKSDSNDYSKIDDSSNLQNSKKPSKFKIDLKIDDLNTSGQISSKKQNNNIFNFQK